MATWKIDPTHSDIEFKVRHLMISNVTGTFNNFDATMESEQEDFSDAKIRFEAQIASISTRNEQRDEHLKSPDFFDAAQFPTLSFESTDVQKKGDDTFLLKGDLSLHGVTKPITFDVSLNGGTVDPYGQTKTGFELSGKINRKDFGLNWSATTEAGGVVVSDEVRLHADIQMVKQA
jgi:polyisoprenoid-binding protein YceI